MVYLGFATVTALALVILSPQIFWPVDAAPYQVRQTQTEKRHASYGPHKRGLAYNDPSYTKLFGGNQSQVSWAYNWGQSRGDHFNSRLEFVPMLWSLDPNLTATWDANAREAVLQHGSKYLFSFNEPDLGGQANITPADAAAGYRKYMHPLAGIAKLGAPAISGGGLPWLKEFYGNCTDCIVDFQPIHWYDTAVNFGWFKYYLELVYSTLPQTTHLWLTEFEGFGSTEQTVNFMETVMPWLDSLSWVDRYAYFGVFDGILLNQSAIGEEQLSETGATYNVYYNATISANI